MLRARLPLLLPFALSTLAAAPAAQTFHPGDLYLVTNALPDPGGAPTLFSGIVRIDAATGAHQLLTPVEQLIFDATSAYDPYRGGILVPGRKAGMPVDTYLMLVDATGAATPVVVGGPNRVTAPAPTGDGRVYYGDDSLHLRCLDALGAHHNVLDASGTQPLALGKVHALTYDGPTQSVLALVNEPSCGFPTTGVVLKKVPLAPGGFQASGPTQSVTVCLTSPVVVTAFTPNHFSRGPGNTVFLSVDDNSNFESTRTFLADPATLTVVPYASNGPYVGAATTTSACWSSLLGQAVLVDGFNFVLRLFPAGSSGLGTVFATGLSGHTSVVTLLEIPPSAIGGVAAFGTGTPGCAGPHALGATETPKVGASDFRFTCTAAPPASLGLTLVADAPDAVGHDLFGLGVLLHLDLLTSTLLLPIDIVSSSFGVGVTPAAIPIAPAFAGATVFAQSLWVWTSCSPTPFGLSTSNGLAVTFQP